MFDSRGQQSMPSFVASGRNTRDGEKDTLADAAGAAPAAQQDYGGDSSTSGVVTAPAAWGNPDGRIAGCRDCAAEAQTAAQRRPSAPSFPS